jgi:hypothetical protein
MRAGQASIRQAETGQIVASSGTSGEQRRRYWERSVNLIRIWGYEQTRRTELLKAERYCAMPAWQSHGTSLTVRVVIVRIMLQSLLVNFHWWLAYHKA